MGRHGHRARQFTAAALTANALQPPSGFRSGAYAFFPGWLTTELAPQLLALTTGDTATQLARGRRDPVALGLTAATTAGLGWIIRQSTRVGDQLEQALEEGLGVDYVEQLDHAPTPEQRAVAWRSVVRPFRLRTGERSGQVRVEKNIAYSDTGGRGLLDIYRPAHGEVRDAPVLLQVHGGGWTIGNKDQQGIPLMQHLAARGWVCVAINYRLAPRDRFPAQIVDVKRAIAWIKEHIASYGGDPDYLAITGGSAGGHLCALTALTPSDPEYQPGFEEADTSVQVAVPHYGVYDMADFTGLPTAIAMRDVFLARRIFPQDYLENPDLYRRASPLQRIAADAPDFFVLHGVHDTLVDVRQAREFVDRLRETSRASVVYAELPGAQHAFDIFVSLRSQHVVRAIDRYLHWHWNTHHRGRAVPGADDDPARGAGTDRVPAPEQAGAPGGVSAEA